MAGDNGNSLFTTAEVSPRGKVNAEDLARWGHNLLVFLIPVALMYLLQINASLQNGALQPIDFVPTAATLGAIELYIINGVTDLLRKFMDPNR